MAKRSADFNLSATIREFQKSHPGVAATAALEAIKKAHSNQKINESTFKATFYKLAGGGTKKSVRRRKPGQGSKSVSVIENKVLAIIRAARELIALTGDPEAAKSVIDHM